ncbi:MAG TPA: hypothetical protein VEK84_08915 [Terriglobales bacterium]|nr:hypothetical protein [Terriglobales bacterium]
MNRKTFSKIAGRGKGRCPFTHPQKPNLVVYTEELTHLSLLVVEIASGLMLVLVLILIRKNCQILGPIVKFIPIFVMYDFLRI